MTLSLCAWLVVVQYEVPVAEASIARESQALLDHVLGTGHNR